MTPEQEEQVRRALAAAAAHRDEPGSMPPEVVARLDDVLADLTAPRTAAARDEADAAHPHRGTRADGGISDLGGRRRRRWPNRLAAAAAVAVIALAGFTVATRGLLQGTGVAESSSAGSGAQDSGAQKAPSEGSTGSRAGSGTGGPSAAAGALPVPRLSSATLRRDVRRVAAAPVGARELSGQAPDGATSSGPACRRPATRRGDELVAVLLDGRPATLVLRATRAGSREAQLYSCDTTGQPLRSTTVPSG